MEWPTRPLPAPPASMHSQVWVALPWGIVPVMRATIEHPHRLCALFVLCLGTIVREATFCHSLAGP